MTEGQKWLCYVIYERPWDYPFHYVVRAWEMGGDFRPKPIACVADSLEEARETIPQGHICVKRGPSYDPCIVETWL